VIQHQIESDQKMIKTMSEKFEAEVKGSADHKEDVQSRHRALFAAGASSTRASSAATSARNIKM
jgi:hypothetical protein